MPKLQAAKRARRSAPPFERRNTQDSGAAGLVLRVPQKWPLLIAQVDLAFGFLPNVEHQAVIRPVLIGAAYLLSPRLGLARLFLQPQLVEDDRVAVEHFSE